MAFSSSSLMCTFTDFAGDFRQWMYRENVNHATIEAAGYFTNGHRLGMRVGDALLFVSGTTTGSSAATWHTVTASTGAVAASATVASSAYNQAFNCSVSLATT